MKRVLFVLAIAGVMIACNSKKKEEKKPEGETTTTTTNTNNTTTTTSTASDGIPTFSDPEVQKFAHDLTAFVNTYIAAMKGKDMMKMAEMAPKWQDWSTRSMSVGQKLAANPEDAKKWEAYWKKVSDDIQAATKDMMPK